MYYGKGDGTFELNTEWKVWFDNHAIVPTRFSPKTQQMSFVLTRGGSFGINPGKYLNPKLLRAKTNSSLQRHHVDVLRITQPHNCRRDEGGWISSFIHGRGRGRSAIFMDLREPGTKNISTLDVILTNAKPIDGTPCGGIFTGATRALLPHSLRVT